MLSNFWPFCNFWHEQCIKNVLNHQWLFLSFPKLQRANLFPLSLRFKMGIRGSDAISQTTSAFITVPSDSSQAGCLTDPVIRKSLVIFNWNLIFFCNFQVLIRKSVLTTAFQSWQEPQDYSALWNFHKIIKSPFHIRVRFCWITNHPKHSNIHYFLRFCGPAG